MAGTPPSDPPVRGLLIEPYHAGSHAAFAETLVCESAIRWELLTLPGRHWKWRMRGAAAHFALAHAQAFSPAPQLVFASSYTPLAELVGLVPELQNVPKVLYFHENQLAYPVSRRGGGPDFHFGMTQLVSCLAADRVLFNSAHNMDSFLEAARELLARMPDARPPAWVETVRARSSVMPLPLGLPAIQPPGPLRCEPGDAAGPLIVWNHRWEYDKAPAEFVQALQSLVQEGLNFRVALLGARPAKAPQELLQARQVLGERCVADGATSRSDYLQILADADIVVSTAIHEFFGIAVVEAMAAGAMPLVPDRLAYRETVPVSYRYPHNLLEPLRDAIRRFHRGESLRRDCGPELRRFSVGEVMPQLDALCLDLLEKE